MLRHHLPVCVCVCVAKESDIIVELGSAMFKPSSACRTPHMNIDNLRDELFQAGIVTRKGFQTDDQVRGSR